jgi:hypothetical protein
MYALAPVFGRLESHEQTSRDIVKAYPARPLIRCIQNGLVPECNTAYIRDGAQDIQY